mmetsp:Transcript_56479/g.132476  ORF Transcript_56479/g.132476 Transcript_56479/m.132476 type:complete len:197 (-) Transcript_56479:33-623(-)
MGSARLSTASMMGCGERTCKRSRQGTRMVLRLLASAAVAALAGSFPASFSFVAAPGCGHRNVRHASPSSMPIDEIGEAQAIAPHSRASSACAVVLAAVAVVAWQNRAMAAETLDDVSSSSLGLALLPEGETDNLLENVKKYWDLAVRFQVGIFANTFGPLIREKGPLKYILAFAVIALLAGIAVTLGAMTSYDFES